MDDTERYAQGMNVRRAVLGGDHVDKAVANTTPFNEPFQDLITRYAWGEIWTRPGLPRATRSLITLSMLIALNRREEVRMHLKAASRTGVTREQVQELLLHSSVYCGVPAANDAFHIARQVFAE